MGSARHSPAASAGGSSWQQGQALTRLLGKPDVTPAQAGRKLCSCSLLGEWASASRRQRGPVCRSASVQTAARPELGKPRPHTHQRVTASHPHHPKVGNGIVSGLTVGQDARQSSRRSSKAAARCRSLP